ncbi:MAG: PQQ-dependent dehydrogenase, methanol/ethanol family [Sphingomonadales bacterium]|nr:PQQ-dependent dehydrogenase, methanol/ethanol family [Sphingomonadales bacterium]MBD3772964.1 PQQ-dependent dehydrogenase, methanol/ethanol family [Paracoccaceae bacterium]
MARLNARLAALLAILLLAACSRGAPGVDTTQIGAGDDWDNPSGDWSESRFSRLEDITPGNVGQLGLAWEYDLGTNRVQEATPVVAGGVMYASGNLGRVYALDAATGKELWTFTPEVDMQANRYACCDQANRGLALAQGKVFVGALDGWLYALDAKTGRLVWKTNTIADGRRSHTITGAPEIAGDVVVIGNGGADYDGRGYVTAYRINDGSQAWRFWIVPHDPKLGPQESPELEAAVKTWDANSRWDIGGGGHAWDAITYDPLLDQLIIGTGNGGPYPWKTRSPAGGDNLYLDSLVALDPRTGAMKWYFQETPRDSWDLTAVQPMVLAELEVDGKPRPVIIHAPKNGFMFVIDRATGKPLAANAIVRTSWASGWDLQTGRPKLTPEYSEYSQSPKIVFPASPGARNWFPAAWDPARKLYFGNVLDMGNLMFVPPGLGLGFTHRAQAPNPGAALLFTPDLAGLLDGFPPEMQDRVKALPQWQWVKDKPWSNQLRAIDPLTGKTRWAVDMEGWQDRSGVMATASGLLFTGTVGGQMQARSSDTGKLLWSMDTGSAIMAAPMTYRVGGVQYVAVQTGFGGGGWPFVPGYSASYRYGNANRILVFRLGGGKVPIPPELPPLEVAPLPPAQAPGVTPETIARGQQLFMASCAMCHANLPRSPAPDLRRISPEVHAQFDEIVLRGLLLPGGMPRWDDLLSEDDVHAIHAYLIALQGQTRASELKLQAAGKPLDARSATILSTY